MATEWGARLQLVGIGLQVVGVALTGYGSGRTFREFASSEERFWSWLIAPSQTWVGQRARWLSTQVRRLLRRPGRKVALAGVARGGGKVNARAQIAYGPIDQADLLKAVIELERRIGELVKMLGALQERVEDQSNAARDATVALRTEMETKVAELRASDRRVAIGGLRPLLLGLTLNVVGLLLIGVGLAIAG